MKILTQTKLIFFHYDNFCDTHDVVSHKKEVTTSKVTNSSLIKGGKSKILYNTFVRKKADQEYQRTYELVEELKKQWKDL